MEADHPSYVGLRRKLAAVELLLYMLAGLIIGPRALG
jgi:hypothetical protein